MSCDGTVMIVNSKKNPDMVFSGSCLTKKKYISAIHTYYVMFFCVKVRVCHFLHDNQKYKFADQIIEEHIQIHS